MKIPFSSLLLLPLVGLAGLPSATYAFSSSGVTGTGRSSPLVSYLNNNNNRKRGVDTSSSSALFWSMKKKTIAVFGASGLTGSEAVFQALQDGDNVIGLTRNPSNLKVPAGSGGEKAGTPLDDESDPNLTMIAGDVTNKQDVDKVFSSSNKKVDGVIIALGGRTSDVGETMLTDGTRNVIAAMKEKGVKRLAVVTSIGVGDSEDQAPFFFKLLMKTVMKKIMLDKTYQEEAVVSAAAAGGSGGSGDLEYCIVRPGGLTVGPPTGIIDVLDGGEEAGSIARADVARFCLDAVKVRDFPHLGTAPCISTIGDAKKGSGSTTPDSKTNNYRSKVAAATATAATK